AANPVPLSARVSMGAEVVDVYPGLNENSRITPMSCRIPPRWIGDVALVIVAGLGLGLGASRLWTTEPSLPELAKREVSRPVQESAERSRAPKPAPLAPGQAAGRRALLIGVTKYDHLPRDRHLEGPANDVRLMRRLLLERYEFPVE